jgi:transcriptional regulator with XRE-family HTH domain
MENNIKNRIIQLMESERLTAGSFAKLIQVNPAAISHILNDRNKPSLEILTKILSTFPTINSEWLILGNGNMYKCDVQSDSTPKEPSLFDVVLPVSQKNDEFKPTVVPENSVSLEANTPQTKQSESTIIEKEIIKEVLVEAPQRKLQKIIVYYSDNSFEELLPS